MIKENAMIAPVAAPEKYELLKNSVTQVDLGRAIGNFLQITTSVF